MSPAVRTRPAWLPVALLLLAGAVVFLPAIRSPLFLDDYFQTAMIEGTYPVPRRAWDLYSFVGDADRATLMDRGMLPWWSHPHLTVRFLRPLSSVLLYADRKVLGNHPLLSHLHSFAWWALAALAARALYRRVLGARAAVLATFIFALAPCHALPLVWLANREVLVSIVFGMLALGALLRFREGGRLIHAASATCLFGLSLLGGEYAVGFGGYALALAVMDRRSPFARRLVALASFALPAAAYLVVRARMGYGAEGSGLYHDPLRHPAAYLQRVPRRLVTLLSESWLTLDPETVDPLPAWALGVLFVAGVAIMVVPLRRALARLDDEGRAHAWWLLLGSVLSLAPVMAVLPAPRLLGASLLGVAGTVALILDRAWFPPEPEPRVGASEIGGLVALGLGFGHLVHGPGAAWVSARGYRDEGLSLVEHAATLRTRLAEEGAPKTEVVLVRGMAGSVFVLPYALDARGTPPPRWRALTLTGHVLVLRRDARTVEIVVPRDRGLFPNGEGNLFRGEGAPLAAGSVVRVPGMRVTVLEVGDAGPRRARFEFDDPLDAPSRTWVTDRFDGLYDATPPPLGFGKPFDAWPPPKEEPKPE
jgi:hypothetical protein